MNKTNFDNDIQMLLEKNKVQHLHVFIKEYSKFFPVFHHPISTDLFINNPNEYFLGLKLEHQEKKINESLTLEFFYSYEDFDIFLLKLICNYFHEYFTKSILKINIIKEQLFSLTLKSITQQILGVENTQEYIYNLIKAIADFFQMPYIKITLTYLYFSKNIIVEYCNTNLKNNGIDEQSLNSMNFSLEEMVNGSIFYSLNNTLSDFSYIFDLNYFIQLLSSLLKQCLFAYMFSLEHLSLINQLNETINQSKTQLYEKDITVMKQFIKIAETEKNKNSLIFKMHNFLITPLNSILGFAMLLKDYENNLQVDEVKLTVKSITVNAIFIQYSLLTILEYSLINQKQFSLSTSSFKLSELYETLFFIIEGLETYHNKSIVLQPCQNDFTITQVKKRIEIVLFGLLFYCIKFIKKDDSQQLSIISENENILIFLQISTLAVDFDYIKHVEYMYKNIKNISTGNLPLEEFYLYTILNIVYESQIKFEIFLEKPDAKIYITFPNIRRK